MYIISNKKGGGGVEQIQPRSVREIRIIEEGEPCCGLHPDHRTNALLYNESGQIIAVGKGDNWLTAIGRLINGHPEQFNVSIKTIKPQSSRKAL